MIVYTPFWNALEQKKVTTCHLIQNEKISSATIDRLRYNRGISTIIINDLCRILNCKVEDMLLYVESEDDQKL